MDKKFLEVKKIVSSVCMYVCVYFPEKLTSSFPNNSSTSSSVESCASSDCFCAETLVVEEVEVVSGFTDMEVAGV